MPTAPKNHPSATCACGTHTDDSGRKALAVDPDIKDRNLKRLRRIEGQVRLKGPTSLTEMCYPCLRTTVTHLPGLNTER